MRARAVGGAQLRWPFPEGWPLSCLAKAAGLICCLLEPFTVRAPVPTSAVLYVLIFIFEKVLACVCRE